MNEDAVEESVFVTSEQLTTAARVAAVSENTMRTALTEIGFVVEGPIEVSPEVLFAARQAAISAGYSYLPDRVLSAIARTGAKSADVESVRKG